MQVPLGAYQATLEFGRDCSLGSPADRRAIASLIGENLHAFDFRLMGIDHTLDENVSWVELANIPPFVVKVGVFEHPSNPNRMLALLYPPLPFVRVWLRKVSTHEVVLKLSRAVEAILQDVAKCDEVRWLSESEARQFRR